MTRKTRWCWRKDLAGFRGLTDRERGGFLVLLEWFENFRLRQELEAGREAASGNRAAAADAAAHGRELVPTGENARKILDERVELSIAR